MSSKFDLGRQILMDFDAISLDFEFIVLDVNAFNGGCQLMIFGIRMFVFQSRSLIVDIKSTPDDPPSVIRD